MEAIGRLRAGWQIAQWHASWSCDWFRRQLGWGASAGLVALIAGAALAGVSIQFQTQARELRMQLTEARAAARVKHAHRPDAAQRLEAFYAALPSATQIPATVSELILLANAKHLALRTAEYRPQIEPAGRYLSYRISLPVAGDAQAIQSFLLAALREHRTLALESVTFKRERVEAHDIEARIQFAFISRIPATGVAPPQTNMSARAQ